MTYSFYAGRLSALNGDNERAERELEYAFVHCPRTHERNRRLALQYLVPVKLARGKLPKQGLLESHGLERYLPIAEAMRTGSIHKFNEGLMDHQERFIRDGVYLILEKLRNTVLRTLARRVQWVHKQQLPQGAEEGEKYRVPLETFRRALAWLGEEKDSDEVECILANLIVRRYVKGMIAHRKQLLILSKEMPFPPLSQATFSEPFS